MTNTTISHSTALHQTPFTAFEHLANQLAHIRNLVDFTASCDMITVKPIELQAQFMAIDNALTEAEILLKKVKWSGKSLD